MSASLSKELQKYYTRKGNRIIFKNGMTLNQLAWEMWEKLGFSSMDSSVLSRVLQGKRSFTLVQLEVFSGIVDISYREYLTLRNILKTEVLARYSLDQNTLIDEDLLFDLLNKDYQIVKMADSSSNPLLAKKVAELSFEFINIYIKNIRDFEVVKEIYRKKAQIMIEYIDSLFGSVCEGDLYWKTLPYIEELKKISNILKDDNLFRNSYTLRASLVSLTNKHYLTEKFVINGLKNGDMNEFNTVTALKCAVVSTSELKNVPKLANFTKILKANVNKLSDSFKCMAYYSLASSEANLGNLVKADKYLKMAWDKYNSLEAGNQYKIARRLSIAKSELYIATKYKGFRDKNYIDQLAKSSIDIAKMTGFFRIKEQYESFLNQL